MKIPEWNIWLTMALIVMWGIAMHQFARRGLIGLAVFCGLMLGVNLLILWLLTRQRQ